MSKILKSASSISQVTLASRILGLIRDAVMFQMLGASWVMGTFALAWMFPNLLRRLFGEGALSASFIPAYTRELQRNGSTAAKRLLSSVTGLMLLALLGITAAALLAMWLLPAEWIGRSGEGVSAASQGKLLKTLGATLFPYCIPICLAAIFAGALNTHGRFALPAASPVLLNLFWLGGLCTAMALGLGDPVATVQLVALFLVVGGLGQMLLSLIPLWRLGHAARPQLPLLPATSDPAFAVLRNMGPTIVGMSLLQVNTMMDQVLANSLIGPHAPSFIYLANRLLLFPHALTSLALATAAFPSFAALAAKGQHSELRSTVDRSLHQTLLVAIPASVGMFLVAAALIQVVFASEQFTMQDTLIASSTTGYLVASLPFIGASHLYARSLYALGNYRTPAWMALWLLLFNVALNLILVLGFGMGVEGLALATTISAAINALGLGRAFRRMCPSNTQRRHPLWPILAGTTLMALAIYFLPRMDPESGRLQVALSGLLLPICTGLAVYGLCMLVWWKALRGRNRS